MSDVKVHSGVYAAPAMPFTVELQPDIRRYIAHCRSLLASGCHGLMPLGSTGESHSLTINERLRVMDALAESGLPLERMLVGASSLALPDTVALVRQAVAYGVGGVCIQPPFYYKPLDEEALFLFYATVIESVKSNRLRLYVYDWEPNIHVHHGMDFFHRLFRTFPDNAVGVKDSSGDAAMLEERCRAFPDREIFVGTDTMIHTGIRAGAVGVMSSISNIIAKDVVALWAAETTEAAAPIQSRIDAIRVGLLKPSFLPALKVAIAWMHEDPDWELVRPPLRKLSSPEKDGLLRRLRSQGIGTPAATEAAE